MDEKKSCTCGNPKFGFNCVCEWVKMYPGDIEFACEWCGIYKASRPQCNLCEPTQGDKP